MKVIRWLLIAGRPVAGRREATEDGAFPLWTVLTGLLLAVGLAGAASLLFARVH